jgi:hypothetical protein
MTTAYTKFGLTCRKPRAMAMKLSGEEADTIMKVGHWTSSTYLVYIHLQVALLTAGLAQRMVHPVYIHNLGG